MDKVHFSWLEKKDNQDIFNSIPVSEFQGTSEDLAWLSINFQSERWGHNLLLGAKILPGLKKSSEISLV